MLLLQVCVIQEGIIVGFLAMIVMVVSAAVLRMFAASPVGLDGLDIGLVSHAANRRSREDVGSGMALAGSKHQEARHTQRTCTVFLALPGVRHG